MTGVRKSSLILATLLCACGSESTERSDVAIVTGSSLELSQEDFIYLTSLDESELTGDDAFRVYQHLRDQWPHYGVEQRNWGHWMDLAVSKGHVAAAQNKVEPLLANRDRVSCRKALETLEEFKIFSGYDELIARVYQPDLDFCLSLVSQ